MASVIQFFFVCAFFANLSHAQLSDRDSDIIIKIGSVDVAKACKTALAAFIANNKIDTKIDVLCTTVTNAGLAGFTGCKQKEYDTIKSVTCKTVKKSNDERSKVVADYGKLRTASSATCQKKMPAKTTLKTWYVIQTLCANMKKDKDYAAQCKGKNGFDDLKDLVCAGTSKIVSGVGAIAMSLVIALFNKM